jgi:hypothetical protein
MIVFKFNYINKSDGFSPIRLLPILVLIAFLTYASSFKLNGRAYHFDALENAVASYHLLTTGTISLDAKSPTQFREPLPIALSALHLKFFTNISEQSTNSSWLGTFQNGERVSQMDVQYPYDYLESQSSRIEISKINLFYIFISMLAVWWLTILLSESNWIACLAVVLSWIFFYSSAYFIYRPMTEYLASFLLLLQSIFMVLYLRRQTLVSAVCFGISFGLLILTKAVALYISFVSVPIILLFSYLHKRLSYKNCIHFLIICFASITLLIAPWMLRNYQNFGSFTLTERGGLVLLTRAMKNQMTDKEYKSAFYVYAPVELKKLHFFREFFGFNDPNRDLSVELERLFRSRPGDAKAAEKGDVNGAKSFFHKAMAYSKQLSLLGVTDVDEGLKNQAKRLIIENPFNHFKTVPLFAWRGIWSFGHPDPIQPTAGGIFSVLFNLVSFVSFLLLPFVAFAKKNVEFFAIGLVAWGMFMFYAFFTHFVPRYSAPLIPLAIISTFILIQAFLTKKTIN